MYGYIQRVQFISVDVSNHLFQQILKRRVLQVVVDKKMIPIEVITLKNEFIRFKFEEEYIDKEIVSIKVGPKYLVRIGQTIDCSVPFRNVKIKK